MASFSQAREYRAVPEVRNSDASAGKRRIWRRDPSDSSCSEGEGEGEMESKSHGSKMGGGSIASLGKYDVKKERRVMPKSYDEGSDFSEQVELIKYEINKRKLSQNEGQEQQDDILTQKRYSVFFFFSFVSGTRIEMVLSWCVDLVLRN